MNITRAWLFYWVELVILPPRKPKYPVKFPPWMEILSCPPGRIMGSELTSSTAAFIAMTYFSNYRITLKNVTNVYNMISFWNYNWKASNNHKNNNNKLIFENLLNCLMNATGLIGLKQSLFTICFSYLKYFCRLGNVFAFFWCTSSNFHPPFYLNKCNTPFSVHF